MDLLLALALAFALLCLAFLVAAVRAARQRRLLGGFTGLVLALLMLSLAALSALVSVGTQGYRALTHEELAAVVETRPTGEQAFEATFHFPDGTTREFELRGDQIYVDARILKWTAVANVLGLHTAYELDRVGGRYVDLDEELTAPRTLHRLGEERTVDLFAVRRSLPFLSPLVDAEYGSGTFVGADEPQLLEVRVSTTGLLIRSLRPEDREEQEGE